ncbi:MAG: aspartate kinase [Atribacterota bacterium]|nr:aspartate kinase [Atribacterota bacterium]MDD3641529.1 aspartate kinase [Atribacterota bacterium]MDD4288306.1 aspartate kinase [Atribacterota bacterium]MDD4764549.1 aspartate kinase [Atribacterota bacterium]
MIIIRIVVKFGGTSIRDIDRIEKATNSIAKKVKEGHEVLVVVSAMGDTTDNLISLLEGVTKSGYDMNDYAQFVSFGERMSAQLVAASLRAQEIQSRPFDPSGDDFPIITNNKNLLEADILSKQSKEQCQTYLEPLLQKGIVPVVCGFLGRSEKDNIITCLGRGGSDITAFALGDFIKADEVIIVTDASGVASADPRLVKKVEMLPKISVEEMGILAESGAKVLHPRALKYKNKNMRSKIIHFQNGDLDSPGTEIEGSFSSKVDIFQDKLCLLTIVGDSILETPGILRDIITPLSKNNISIQSIAIGIQYIGIYVSEKYSKKAYDLIHLSVLKSEKLKSVTSKEDIALIVVSSRDFIDTPGIIEKITRPLAENNINILEMVTIKTDILIFVSWNNKDKVYQLIRQTLGEIGINTQK